MALVNEDYLRIPEMTSREDIERRVNAFRVLNPERRVLRLDSPVPMLAPPEDSACAIRRAAEELCHKSDLKGDTPVQGYDFLLEKIRKNYHRTTGIEFEKEAIFVASGMFFDLENLMATLGSDNIIAIAEVSDPNCKNAALLVGKNDANTAKAKENNLLYLKCNEQTGFVPQLPEQHADIIFLSNPNTVTGTLIDRAALKRWVDYATRNESIIIYDSSFCQYIHSPNIPRSIYEIKGAKKVAIELHTYLPNAASAALRCGFLILPVELQVHTIGGEAIMLNKLWKKRLDNFSNGVSYIAQRGAEALYTRRSKGETVQAVSYYKLNASLIREQMLACGAKVYGGENSPFVWVKLTKQYDSWKFFNMLLCDCGIVSIPGAVFGKESDNYMMFSAFCNRSELLTALESLNLLF